MDTLMQNLSKDWNQNFIGYSALTIILSTCVGSIAVMVMLKNGIDSSQLFQLFLVVCGCSAHNAFILTVQKPNVVFKFLVVSLVISITIGSINF